MKASSMSRNLKLLTAALVCPFPAFRLVGLLGQLLSSLGEAALGRFSPMAKD